MQPSPLSIPLHCHLNVKEHVSIHGGKAVLGWQFRSYKDGLDYEAIRHSIWESPDGELVDITPTDPIVPYQCFSILGTDLLPHRRNVYYRSLDKYMSHETKLMYYIYALVDPRSNAPFYIGKGTGKRAQTHLWDISRETNPYKENMIRAIRSEGLEPQITYLAEDILDEELAYDIEASIIRSLGRKGYDEGGILTNVCIDARPPSLRGRTYEDIYGPERAREQIEKRRALQLAAGGYGPKSHSEETKRKIGAKSATRTGWSHREDTKKKIGDFHRTRRGKNNACSHQYVLTAPNGEEHILYGYGEVRSFCIQNDLSYGTFLNALSEGWGPAKKGKNIGWTIRVAVSKQHASPEVNSILHVIHPDGREERIQGSLGAICRERGWNASVVRNACRAARPMRRGALTGMAFRVETFN